MLETLIIGGSILLLFTVGYAYGWMAGHSSGKVAAIEAAHDIDLSGGELE